MIIFTWLSKLSSLYSPGLMIIMQRGYTCGFELPLYPF